MVIHYGKAKDRPEIEQGRFSSPEGQGPYLYQIRSSNVTSIPRAVQCQVYLVIITTPAAASSPLLIC